MLLEHATKLMVMLCYVVDVKGIILIQSCIPAPKCLEISTDKMLEEKFSPSFLSLFFSVIVVAQASLR